MNSTLLAHPFEHPTLWWTWLVSGLGLALLVGAWHYRARKWSTVLFGAGVIIAALPVYRAVAVNRAITEQGVLAANAERITELCATAARAKVPVPVADWRFESSWLQWQSKPCSGGRRCPSTHLHIRWQVGSQVDPGEILCEADLARNRAEVLYERRGYSH